LHPSYGGKNGALLRPTPAGPETKRASSSRSARHDIDWRAVRLAGRACCCSARPAVVAVLEPADGRPDAVDLLLCLHHYRASRTGLAAAGASILDMDGGPVPDTDWPEVL